MNKAIFTETINPMAAHDIPDEYIKAFEAALLKALYDQGSLNENEYYECLQRL